MSEFDDINEFVDRVSIGNAVRDEQLKDKLVEQRKCRAFYDALPESTRRLLDDLSELQAKMKTPREPKKKETISHGHSYTPISDDLPFDCIPMREIPDLPPPLLLPDRHPPVKYVPPDMQRGSHTSPLAVHFLTPANWLRFLEQPLPLETYLVSIGMGEDLKQYKEYREKLMVAHMANKRERRKMQGLDGRFKRT